MALDPYPFISLALSTTLANVKNAPISWLINREILAMEETTDVTPDTPPARKRCSDVACSDATASPATGSRSIESGRNARSDYYPHEPTGPAGMARRRIRTGYTRCLSGAAG